MADEQQTSKEGKLINSKEYWEARFESGDWNRNNGDEQSTFFTQTALNAFPEFLKQDLARNQWKIIDFGCARGDGTAVLAQNFPMCEVEGVDFSEEAIRYAKERFPYCSFSRGNMEEKLAECDIAYSSNTLEHLKHPQKILQQLCASARRYAVVLLPMEDEFGIEEHFYKFDREFFPVLNGNSYLQYSAIIDCEKLEPTYWIGHQILLVYTNMDYRGPNNLTLEVIYSYCAHTLEKQLAEIGVRLQEAVLEKETTLAEVQQLREQLEGKRLEAQQLHQNLEDSCSEAQQQYQQLEKKEIALIEAQQQLNQQLEEKEIALIETQQQLNQQLEEKEVALLEIRQMLNHQRQLNNEKQAKEATLLQESKNCKCKIVEVQYRYDMLLEKNSSQSQEATQQVLQLQTELKLKNQTIQSALAQCNGMLDSRLFKLVHLLNRFKQQGFHSDRHERKLFWKWIRSRGKGVPDFDRRYNPMFSVIEKLQATAYMQGAGSGTLDGTQETAIGKHLFAQKNVLERYRGKRLGPNALHLKERLEGRDYSGILIYPHTVYWEPLQTPQQLLLAFAEQGWLCIFCEHPEIKNAYQEVNHNLYIAYESDVVQLFSGLPEFTPMVLMTWAGSYSFLNLLPAKTIWYHILDKLDLFPYYGDAYLGVHKQLLMSATVVSYVAEPLKECIQDREDAIHLPNAVNSSHLLNLHEGFVPEDLKPILAKNHKIIGYYGYLAEWLDYELIQKAAALRPDYEFVFIGKAIYDTAAIDTLPNVHLLGLKRFEELSDYAKFFDVATVPFRITPQMDCVSPIKFYEYCAMGLPVLVSRMPEMLPYACDFIACYSGIDEFIYFLDHFSTRETLLLAKEQGPDIASQNSWTSRAKTIISAVEGQLDYILEQKYNKSDIIIFGIIDYDFRHQRPQHFALRFVENGHRVFYINANHYKETSVQMISDGMYVINLQNKVHAAIHLTDWKEQRNLLSSYLDRIILDYGISDAITIVDYPNWLLAVRYLKESYGFHFVTDYMDDFTGFLNPAEDLVRENCLQLLKESDAVVASSQFLYDIACKSNANTVIIRNGTEYAHFHTAFEADRCLREAQVIGYYGAIAHWFDAEKICKVAEQFPQCKVSLIGEVTAWRKEFEKHSNIELLGEIPYQDLPQYLKNFDVCLIPFDTSTDLIKATNPVKFYEYLSAGKKVVATEIPEISPYQDKYVYMANDNSRFMEYISLCLTGKDTLATPEECTRFAKENDWQVRYEALAQQCKNVVPKVSIIVLTYNNLRLNKLCINSILEETAYYNYELIVVDNMSTDGTKEYLQDLEAQQYRHIKIIFNEVNTGFAGGNNIGIRAATGEYVLLLNNDTIVTRGWITSMVKHLENHPELGMVGPVTNSIGNEAKIVVDYHNIKTLKCFAFRYTHEHLNVLWQSPSVLALFCTMIKREVFESCGFLDEQYQVGMFEDDDYAEVVRRGGYFLAIAEDSFIHHFEGASFKKLENSRFKEIYECNRALFEKKWDHSWTAHKYRPGVTWNTGLENNLLNSLPLE